MNESGLFIGFRRCVLILKGNERVGLGWACDHGQGLEHELLTMVKRREGEQVASCSVLDRVFNRGCIGPIQLFIACLVSFEQKKK